jgi:hypothetical protein
VGDVRREVPTIGKTGTVRTLTSEEPQECTVVEVHPDRLWYRVQFKDSGCFECYKVPKYKPPYISYKTDKEAQA